MPEIAVSKKPSETPQTSHPGELSRALGFNPFTGPFTMMREFTEQMERMFRGSGSGAEAGIQAWTPTIDVQRCGGNLMVSAELPGLKPEDVSVEILDDQLIIEGERKQEHKEDHQGYHRWERSYGRFYRAIDLPEGAQTDQVKAELKEGVLRVTVPVPEMEKKARHVPVAG